MKFKLILMNQKLIQLKSQINEETRAIDALKEEISEMVLEISREESDKKLIREFELRSELKKYCNIIDERLKNIDNYDEETKISKLSDLLRKINEFNMVLNDKYITILENYISFRSSLKHITEDLYSSSEPVSYLASLSAFDKNKTINVIYRKINVIQKYKEIYSEMLKDEKIAFSKKADSNVMKTDEEKHLQGNINYAMDILKNSDIYRGNRSNLLIKYVDILESISNNNVSNDEQIKEIIEDLDKDIQYTNIKKIDTSFTLE